MKNNKKSSKKTNKSKSINVRLTENEKKQLDKQASEYRLSLSDYIRCKLFTSRKFGKGNVCFAVEALQILNHIEDTYGSDEKLQERIDVLWKSLL